MLSRLALPMTYTYTAFLFIRIFVIRIARLKFSNYESQFGKYLQKMKNELTKIKKTHFKPIIKGGQGFWIL